MAISDKINSIKTHIGEAYTAIQGKEGTIPANKNCENLKNAIESIPTSGKTQEKTVNITENGVIITTPDTGYDGMSSVTTVTNVQPDLQEKSVTPTESQQIATPDAGYDGLSKVTVSAIQTKETSVTPAKGQQVLEVTDNKYYKKVTVEAIPPDYVIPSGTIQITENGVVDVSGKANANVNVPSKEEEAKTVDLAMASGNQTITPTSGKVLSQVVVKKPATMLPENIKKDVNIGGVTGTLESGGGGELNIAYGDTAPEDTSKLWIKSEEPSNISFPVVWKPEQIVYGLIDIGKVLPKAAYDIGTAAVGTKIYLFGGNGSSMSDTIQVFDTTNNTIQTLSTKLPTTTYGIDTAVVGTKIYLIGGTYLGDKVLVFDTTNNTIQTLSITLPHTMGNCGTAAVGTKIYLFGGTNTRNMIQVFDTTNNTIQTLSTKLPDGVTHIAAAAVGAKIYLFGGHIGSNSALNKIQVFDTTNNTIQTLSAKLSMEEYFIAAAAVGTKIYLFGGNGSSMSDTIQVFDTTTNTIQTLSTKLPTAAYGIGTAAVGTKIYLFGGLGSKYLNTINQFTVDVPLSSNDIIVTQEYYSRTFKVMKAPTEVEVAVKYVYKGDQNLAKFIDAYLSDGTNWINVNTGDFTFTKLYAPKIKISNETLIITNDSRNGSKVTSYEIYKDGVLLTTTTNTSFDLSSLISEVGTYAITVKAVGADIAKSELSNEAKYFVLNMTYAANQVASDTSLTTSVNCQVGDLVVAAIIVRSALTLPDGWTLVSTSNVISGDTTNQTLSFAYKVATSTSESITVTQATSGRIYTTVCALQGAKSVKDIGYSYATNKAGSLTVNKNGGVKLWGASSTTWKTSTPYGDWTCSAPAKYVAVDQSTYAPRLGVFYEPDDALRQVKFTSVVNSSDGIIVGGLNISYESEQYSITPTLTNVTAASGNATTIATGETKVLTYTAASGYTLPDSVTVTGATGVWNKDAGTLTLSNPTGNVTFTIAGVEATSSRYQLVVTEVYDGGSAAIKYKDGTSATVGAGTYQNVVSIQDVYYGGDLSQRYTLTDSSGNTHSVPYTLTSNTTIEISSDHPCIIEDTQITLANGTTKAIEDITYDDELLVWNFYDGKFDKAKPSWIKVEETATRYNLVKFSNGSEVGFVGPGGDIGYHRIFNKEAKAFTHTGVKDTPNGTTTFAQDGTFPTVISQEVVEKEVKFYNVITDKHYNLFANGILTSCRLSNKYRIEDMRYVGEKLISDEQEKAYFERIENKRK